LYFIGGIMPDKNPLTGKKTTTRKTKDTGSTTRPPLTPSPYFLPTGDSFSPVADGVGGVGFSIPMQGFSDTLVLPYSVPLHDPNILIPTDIYDPSTSSGVRLKRDEADRRIEVYSELIAGQEVAEAGYNFISSIFKTQTAFQKALGNGFTALRETLSTQRKQVAAATANVDLSTERLKFGRSVQLNQQATIKLNGEIVKTGLTQERTDTEILKVRNEIQGLKTQAQQALLKAQALELSA
jgi:hypothetical protein